MKNRELENALGGQQAKSPAHISEVNFYSIKNYIIIVKFEVEFESMNCRSRRRGYLPRLQPAASSDGPPSSGGSQPSPA